MAGNTHEAYAQDVIMGAKDEDATSTNSGTSGASRASVQSWSSSKKQHTQKPASAAAENRPAINATKSKPNFAAVITRSKGASTGQGKGRRAHYHSYSGKGKSSPYTKEA